MKIETSPEFAAFVAKYPLHRRNRAKRDAWKAWNQAMKRGVTLEQIMLTLDERIHCDWVGRKPEHIPYMASFLRAESFESDTEAAEDDKEPVLFPDYDQAEILQLRAEMIRQRLMMELGAWEIERVIHHHNNRCSNGEVCRFADAKRPFVPSMEEILARLK